MVALPDMTIYYRPIYADPCFSRGSESLCSYSKISSNFLQLMAGFHRAVCCFNGRRQLLKTLRLGMTSTIPEGISRRARGRTVGTAVKNLKDIRNVEKYVWIYLSKSLRPP